MPTIVTRDDATSGISAAEPTTTGATGFLSSVSIQFNKGVGDLNKNVKDALDKLKVNPSDPELLANYQSALSEYTLYRQAQSSVVKAYKDVGAGIIANYR